MFLMFWCNVIITFNSLLVIVTRSADVFDPNKCQKGCFNDDNCPQHALCVPVLTTSDCGICVCHDNYVPVGNQCRPGKSTSTNNKATNNRPSPQQPQQPQQPLPTPPSNGPVTPPVIFSVAKPTSILKDQSGGAVGPEPIDCSMYNCGPQPESGIDNDPFKVRTQVIKPQPAGCKNKVINDVVPCSAPMAGNFKECRGSYCLAVKGISYCICPYSKVGEGCNEDKPGSCSLATGQIPPQSYIKTNVRYKHAIDPNQGSIIARHFALGIVDCIKLCQWTGGKCNSVNYGPMNEHNVCELLSIAIKNPGTLQNWLTNEPGWTYACCF